MAQKRPAGFDEKRRCEMTPPNNSSRKGSGQATRHSKRDLQRQVSRYAQLLQVGLIITSEMNFDVLFGLIIAQTTAIMEAERCSIFLIDKSNRYLRAFVSTDLAPNEIQIEKDHGVAGWVFCNRQSVIIDDPYNDPRFCQAVDKATGYRTQCILCVPLINRRNECIGTLQVLNKVSGRFREDDLELLGYLASFTTIALENSLLYEEIRASDAAKQKVIDHLSHELKTPLAVIAGVFKRLSDSFPARDRPRLARTIDRGRRNVERLIALQEKVDDTIAHRRESNAEPTSLEMVDTFVDMVEGMCEEEIGRDRALLTRIGAEIKSILSRPPPVIEKIRLDAFLEAVCQRAVTAAGGRELDIRKRFDSGLLIELDRQVLNKVFDGLLKNAIENTPDGGRIDVEAFCEGETVSVRLRDTGVGIAAKDQQHIFGGFFHTQPTAFYASKSPYQFNAGGTGSDLMRIKAFSERFGFSLNLTSRRCNFLKADTDQCPGRISACPHASSAGACAASGGSTFLVRFPASRLGLSA
jgi:signal transduction histidine kinase